MFWFGWNTGFLLDNLKSLFSSYSDIALSSFGGSGDGEGGEGGGGKNGMKQKEVEN